MWRVYGWMKNDLEFREKVDEMMKEKRETKAAEFMERIHKTNMDSMASNNPRMVQAASTHVRVEAEALGLIGGKGQGTVTINNQVISVPGLLDLVKKADVWEEQKRKAKSA